MEKKKINIYREYCTGCGLCNSVYGIDMEETKEGFVSVKNELSKNAIEILSKICPVKGNQCKNMSYRNIWGKYCDVYLAYANDLYIRNMGSSGGILTALCIFLLESKLVNGIIQVCEDTDNAINTKVVCSRNKDEVLKCSGSRYSSSMTLGSISQYLNNNEKYCLVGKPCDIICIKNFLEFNGKYKDKFPYMFSFFCAGVPSKVANLKLIESLNCTEENLASLRYRGDGWPGNTTIVDKHGNKYTLSYDESWGKILGRDIRKICRFCIDGIGELADISCGDAWFLDENNKPVFKNSLYGRNVVFCRNEKGLRLFKQACDNGIINSEKYFDFEKELIFSQYFQYNRRALLKTEIKALKMVGKDYPDYPSDLLEEYSKNISLKTKLSYFWGTISRIRSGKI